MKMRISISRKINTAAYENIVISVDLERDCVDADEDAFKTALRKETIAAYRDAESQVLAELSLVEKHAHQENKPDQPAPKALPRKQLTDKDLEGIL